MISDNQLRIMAGSLGLASVVSLALFLSGLMTFSFYAAFPIHVGVIVICGYLMRQYRKRLCHWDRHVPAALLIALSVMLAAGLISIAYGFANVMPAKSPTGEAVSQFSANFEGGICYATYNRGLPVRMPSAFCDDFIRQFSVAFCGFWLVGSAIANWAAWKRRKI
jgi:asparagine N-glycosylation enzyme membrane subunit Stt3